MFGSPFANFRTFFANFGTLFARFSTLEGVFFPKETKKDAFHRRKASLQTNFYAKIGRITSPLTSVKRIFRPE